MIEAIFVYTTFPSEAEAAVAARAVVGEKLAACANLIPGMKSFYEWEGKMEEGAETVLILKTRSALFESLAARLRQLHTADIPCIVALPLANGTEDFLGWVQESTNTSS